MSLRVSDVLPDLPSFQGYSDPKIAAQGTVWFLAPPEQPGKWPCSGEPAHLEEWKASLTHAQSPSLPLCHSRLPAFERPGDGNPGFQASPDSLCRRPPAPTGHVWAAVSGGVGGNTRSPLPRAR